ncbi:MAG TPA: alpha/beta fold hydrolase [Jiangellaceae bacterium]|nr:alpha/beta fold hydrolase [Jiangellaceae bacterium]
MDLSAGPIEYEDTRGSGPIVVLLHGVAINASLWRHVVRALRDDHRVVVPTLPLGGHRLPMRADADLSPRGIGELEAEFLEALDLRDVTLIGNDQGSFQFATAERPERIARLVITSSEAFENFPPGLPGHALSLAARLPGGLYASIQPLRLRVLRRSPIVLGRMSKKTNPARGHGCLAASAFNQAGDPARSDQVHTHGQTGRHARRGRTPAVLRPKSRR